MPDCRTCKFNTYLDIANCDFVSCGHPITLERRVLWQKGDPAWVAAFTGDFHVDQIERMRLNDCPTYEAATGAVSASVGVSEI